MTDSKPELGMKRLWERMEERYVRHPLERLEHYRPDILQSGCKVLVAGLGGSELTTRLRARGCQATDCPPLFDPTTMPDSAPFDVVLLFNVLQGVRLYGLRIDLLAWCRNTLGPEGKLVVTVEEGDRSREGASGRQSLAWQENRPTLSYARELLAVGFEGVRCEGRSREKFLVGSASRFREVPGRTRKPDSKSGLDGGTQ